MKFDLEKSVQILSRTPGVLKNLLNGLHRDWTYNNEGENTWSPALVLGHLILGEKTDWIVRSEIILGSDSDKRFQPFNMTAHFKHVEGKSIEELLIEFAELRTDNLKRLKSFNLSEEKKEYILDHLRVLNDATEKNLAKRKKTGK